MPGNDPIQSLQRGIAILQEVAGTDQGLTPRQIAQSLNVKPATIYRFLHTLEMERLLVRQPAPLRYMLGPAISDLHIRDSHRRLLTVGAEVLVRHHARLSRASLVLTECVDSQVYVRLQCLPQQPGKVMKVRHLVNEPYIKPSSLTFLAFAQPDEECRFRQTHPFPEEGFGFWKSERSLQAFLIKIRRQGYAVLDRRDDSRRYRVAVPVRVETGPVLAVVAGFIGLDDPLPRRKQLLSRCLAAATDLSRRLMWGQNGDKKGSS